MPNAAPIDAIDELVARSKDHAELRKFHKFHRANPEVLDFLVTEIRLLIGRGFKGFSFASLVHYSRWKLKLETGPTITYALNDHLTPFFARAILIIHADLNGKAEMRGYKGGPALADQIFGTRLMPVSAKRPGDYARRLEWADGTALGDGWRPSIPHEPTRPTNRKPDIH